MAFRKGHFSICGLWGSAKILQTERFAWDIPQKQTQNNGSPKSGFCNSYSFLQSAPRLAVPFTALREIDDTETCEGCSFRNRHMHDVVLFTIHRDIRNSNPCKCCIIMNGIPRPSLRCIAIYNTSRHRRPWSLIELHYYKHSCCSKGSLYCFYSASWNRWHGDLWGLLLSKSPLARCIAIYNASCQPQLESL